MPFLRRRGNLASESDMRHRTKLNPDRDPGAADSMLAPRLPQYPESRDDGEPRRSAATDDAFRTSSDAFRRDSSVVSRMSTTSRPETPTAHDESIQRRRFSILRFRNASDSQLAVRAKMHADKAPPMPVRPPEIITTAPTNDIIGPKKKASRMSLANKFRRSHDLPRGERSNIVDIPSSQAGTGIPLRKSIKEDRSRPSLATLEEPQPSAQATDSLHGPALASQTARQSESSKSDASSTDPTTPNTTPRKSQSSTSFFKMRKSRKHPDSLLGGLSHLPQKNKLSHEVSSSTSLTIASSARPSSAQDRPMPRESVDRSEGSLKLRGSPAAAFFAPSGNRSGHSSPTRTTLMRGRSSTLSSVGGRDSTDDHLLPPTARTSSSTGRKSFGDLLGLSRLRPNPEFGRQGTITPLTPGSGGSQSNSLQLTRQPVFLPDKRDDDSPAKYLSRVEELIPRSRIAAMLSTKADAFMLAVLRSYMRSYMLYGDPLDMAIRKLLMEAELPKETQHIDRCLQAFANRYHECNPGIYSSSEQAYFAAFSLLILHTDVFNKNNKRKMSKADYLKNTGGQGIFDDILECFYDNINYTPFIHMEDDQASSGDRGSLSKSKRKQILVGPGNDPAKRAMKEPVDPYLLILDNNLDALRPNLKDVLPLDDTYNYLGTSAGLNLKDLQKTFFRTGVLQIVSARSRPEAFMTDKSAMNAEVAGPGIVDIKVTKVGLLWRKDVKRRKTRSPWQEWGAILTGAQLYFFRNVGWVKHLMHQYEGHVKNGHDGIPIIFKPPLEDFKPDSLMSTDGAVALVDASYKKHKNAFVYVRQGGLDEVLLADNEEERNDWLAKLNYAAAFRTSGVKMRGVIGANYDGQGRRGMRRLDSSEATQLVQTPSGPVSIARSRIDVQMVEEMKSARREYMARKISEADLKLETSHKQLEEQLRNARHIQIMAPIQPKTRAQLLSAAARMAAQLQWTRMEIWKEKCHRDILVQDLEEDQPGSSAGPTPTKLQGPGPQHHERTQSPTPIDTRRDSKRLRSGKAETTTIRRPSDIKVSHAAGSPIADSAGSPLDQTFYTPPQSANAASRESQEVMHTDLKTGRKGSISSGVTSPLHSPSSSRHRRYKSREADDSESIHESEHGPDDVDAGEHDLLKQAGLLNDLLTSESAERITATTSADSADMVSAIDREKVDKAKLRRSLQRTLREGAGHLSHHRSRKGKEASTGGLEDSNRESMLSRGTGSFVVHGKKASVIDLGTELKQMTTDERMRAKTQGLMSDASHSPTTLSPQEEDDFHSILGHVQESLERRESAASASTATARSFRELHRKYSSAQAVGRSTSAGGRLTVPSDTDSEAALSFSDGRRSPLPPIECEDTPEQEASASTMPAAVGDQSTMEEALQLEKQQDKHREVSISREDAKLPAQAELSETQASQAVPA